MKKVLITGGAGFIGSNLTIELVKKGYNVRILDNLSKQIHGDNPGKTSPLYNSVKDKVEFLKGSVTNKSDFEKALKGLDAVIHLAAETGTGQSMYEIQKYVDVNVGGTAVLLDILANQKHHVKKIIIASSRAIYGEGKYLCKQHGDVYPGQRSEDDMSNGIFESKCPYCHSILSPLPTSEDSKIHPHSIYGITKQSQEQMVMLTGKSLGIPAVSFRYQNVYGPGQSLSNPYTGILSIFSNLIKSHKNIQIFEDGKESRDFVFIDDVVRATLLGLENDGADGEIFNVGTGKAVSVLEIAKILVKNYNAINDIDINGSYRLGDIRHNFADITKIKSNLDFTPEYTVEQGISLFCKWVNESRIEKLNFDESLAVMKEKGLLKTSR